MLSEPVWLDADLVVEFNQITVAETGEPHGVRDMGGLESALARPQHYWNYGEIDAVVLAVTLLTGIGQSHPFVQGNKRTAFAAADYFLYLNGYDLTVPDGLDLADFVRDVIIGEVSEQRLVEVMWDYVRKR